MDTFSARRRAGFPFQHIALHMFAAAAATLAMWVTANYLCSARDRFRVNVIKLSGLFFSAANAR
jgi:hypothetical protein